MGRVETKEKLFLIDLLSSVTTVKFVLQRMKKA